MFFAANDSTLNCEELFFSDLETEKVATEALDMVHQADEEVRSLHPESGDVYIQFFFHFPRSSFCGSLSWIHQTPWEPDETIMPQNCLIVEGKVNIFAPGFSIDAHAC